ncbi:MAG TPA: recombinase family protein [Ktedonobacteraceae bacterium]|nr:recombinase family protein [Ktedonobacteraceae bacterium]
MSEQLRRIGYIRTSPTDPHPNVQADVLKQAECTKLHKANRQIDKCQALRKILDRLGGGDALIVYRMDRLGRNEHHIENFQRQLEAMGVELVVANEQEMYGENYEK